MLLHFFFSTKYKIHWTLLPRILLVVHWVKRMNHSFQAQFKKEFKWIWTKLKCCFIVWTKLYQIAAKKWLYHVWMLRYLIKKLRFYLKNKKFPYIWTLNSIWIFFPNDFSVSRSKDIELKSSAFYFYKNA